MSESRYPECERWAELHDQALAIGEFIEYLQRRGYNICKLSGYTYPYEDWEGNKKVAPDGCGIQDPHFRSVSKSTEHMIMECYDIDYNKIEKERQKILRDARSI